MKRFLFLSLAVALCAGCHSTYKMTLNNGEVMYVRGKPKYVKARDGFIYTDSHGQQRYISQGAVQAVAPADWNSKNDKTPVPYVQ